MNKKRGIEFFLWALSIFFAAQIYSSINGPIKFNKVKFSKMHSNFIENNGNSSADVERLINFTINEVKKKFNIILEPEIKIIGEK